MRKVSADEYLRTTGHGEKSFFDQDVRRYLEGRLPKGSISSIKCTGGGRIFIAVSVFVGSDLTRNWAFYDITGMSPEQVAARILLLHG